MKKIVFFICLSVVAEISFSQQTEPSKDLTRQQYFEKARHQNTAAWIILGTGTCGLLGTFLIDITHKTTEVFVTVVSLGTVEPKRKNYTGGYVTSLVCMAASIPFFISSSGNKEKGHAASVYLKMEKAPLLQSIGIVNQSYPSIAVKIIL